MIYNITEVFSSIQGEGRWVGHQMTFVRFAGCNLHCKWCDQPTSSVPEQLIRTTMTDHELIDLVDSFGNKRVCLTGGEPLLQVDEVLLARLVHHGHCLHLETNGTLYSNFPFHWITVSPKGPINKQMYDRADELKFIVDEFFNPIQVIPNLKGAQVYLQPCNGADEIDYLSLERTLNLLKNRESWALSVQLHKILHVR